MITASKSSSSNAFEIAHVKRQTENQIKMQYFIKQLAKMRKRLKVLEMIK